jgi:DUF177 domain-containing protein
LEVEAPVLITPRELELHKKVVAKEYASGEIDYHGVEFEQRGTLAVEAVAELAGEEIRIRGHLETRLEAHCDRCLAPVEFPVWRDFDLAYRPLASIAHQEEVEVPGDELAVGFYSGEGIVLADLLSEQVILSVPMKIVCRADCRGLCPVCGADRNREECHCSSPLSESPFAKLK